MEQVTMLDSWVKMVSDRTGQPLSDCLVAIRRQIATSDIADFLTRVRKLKPGRYCLECLKKCNGDCVFE